WCLSRRSTVEDAVEDLRKREKAGPGGIGCIRITAGESEMKEGIEGLLAAWGLRQGLEAVIWTPLGSNSETVRGPPFSVEAGVAYLNALRGPAKERAEQYLRRALSLVSTPLRTAIQSSDWFTKPS